MATFVIIMAAMCLMGVVFSVTGEGFFNSQILTDLGARMLILGAVGVICGLAGLFIQGINSLP